MEKSICQLMNFRQITLQWIEKMLFYDKIRLKDIPTEIRISSADIYCISHQQKQNFPSISARSRSTLFRLDHDGKSRSNEK